jgi:hypothetical protein
MTPDTSPRGVKRSRSPETYGDLQTGGDGAGDDGMFLYGLAVTGVFVSRYNSPSRDAYSVTLCRIQC